MGWWYARRSTFPTLWRVAQAIVQIPASPAPYAPMYQRAERDMQEASERGTPNAALRAFLRATLPHAPDREVSELYAGVWAE